MHLIIAIVCIIIVFKLQASMYKILWKKGFSVDVSVEHDTCQVGDTNVLTEIIDNNKFLPLPMVHVKFNTPRSFAFDDEENSSITDYYYRDDVFTLPSHKSITRKLTFTCTQRGCFYMNDININTSDLLIGETLIAKIKNNIIIHVYPRKLSMAPFEVPFNTMLGESIADKHLIDDPFEFRGIREYQPYDPMKSINWKSSASHGALQVNTFFSTASKEVTIFLNVDLDIYSKNEHLQENTISIASTLACSFINSRIPVALETNAHDTFTKEQICKKSGSGSSHMDAIDHSLSRIDLSLPYDDYFQMVKNYFDSRISNGRINNNAFYVFISNYHHQDIMDYYMSLKDMGIPCYYIIPEMRINPVEITLPDVTKWEVD